MPSLFSTTFRIRAASGANILLYFAGRLPWAGRLVTPRVYAAGRAKSAVTLAAAILREISGVLTKLLYVFGMGVLAAGFLSTGEPFSNLSGLFPQLCHILFWLSCFLPFFTDSVTLKATRDKFICVKFMRAEPRRYMLATVPFSMGVFFAAFLPVILLAALVTGGGLWGGLGLWFMLLSLRVCAEAFQLWWYKHFHFALFRKALSGLGCLLTGLAAAYAPVALGRPLYPAALLLTWPGMLALTALSAACCRYVFWGYGYWRRAITENLKLEYVLPNRAAANQAAFRDVQMKESDLSAAPAQSARIARKTGYAYFNALFFFRHRRMLFKPVLIRLAIVGALFGAAAVLTLTMPAAVTPLIRRIPDYLPMAVFVMYWFSVGAKACKAMFYNCDNSMLRYAFYRRPAVILQCFNIRLRYVAGYNLLVGLGVCAAVVALTWLAKINPLSPDMGAFCGSVLLLCVFFSVHYLFLYYVFQPYTTDLSVKNPFHGILNMAVYAACFACFQIHTAGMPFVLGVLGVTAAYITAALILTARFSPRFFRVK